VNATFAISNTVEWNAKKTITHMTQAVFNSDGIKYAKDVAMFGGIAIAVVGVIAILAIIFCCNGCCTCCCCGKGKDRGVDVFMNNQKYSL
jgi:hypothetical protein